jgi:hypothetical protein
MSALINPAEAAAVIDIAMMADKARVDWFMGSPFPSDDSDETQSQYERAA